MAVRYRASVEHREDVRTDPDFRGSLRDAMSMISTRMNKDVIALITASKRLKLVTFLEILDSEGGLILQVFHSDVNEQVMIPASSVEQNVVVGAVVLVSLASCRPPAWLPCSAPSDVRP